MQNDIQKLLDLPSNGPLRYRRWIVEYSDQTVEIYDNNEYVTKNQAQSIIGDSARKNGVTIVSLIPSYFN